MREGHTVLRHSLLVRVTHWINAVSFFLLIPSGALIAWAHPEFYWGETGYYGEKVLLRLPVRPNWELSAIGRNLHFLAAWMLVLNGLVYLASGFRGGHFRQDLYPLRSQLRWRHLLLSIVKHAKLHTPIGDEALQYNILQKLTYLIVIFICLPLMLLTGLSMSPGATAAMPWLYSLWGRQSARTIHFLCANALLTFLIVHVFQVFVAGFVNEMRSMITGRYRVPPREPHL